MSTPEQRTVANNRRGYSKAYLAQSCTCGCNRSGHRNMTGRCAQCSWCDRFTRYADPQAVSTDPREVYCLGTVGNAPRAPQVQEDESGRVPESPAAMPSASTNWRSMLDSARERDLRAAGQRTSEPIQVRPPSPTAPREPQTPALRSGTASRCPFCFADDFESAPSIKCPNCKAWQHVACVQEYKKCAACKVEWPV